MRLLCTIALCVESLLIVLPSLAEELVLDIDAAVDLALENNLSIQYQRIDLGMKERAKDTTWNEFIPSIDSRISANRTYAGQGGSGSTSDASPWDLSFGLQMNLALSAATRFGIRNALLEYRKGVIDLETARKRLERDIRISFYNLILSRHKIRLIEQNIETSQKRYELARKNYEAGRVSELDMLNALVTVENLKPRLNEANVAYQTEQMHFKQYIGLDMAKEIRLEGSIEAKGSTVNADSLIQEHLDGRLDVRSLVLDGQILENKKRLTAAEEFAPVLSLSYSYSPSLNDPFGSDWGESDNWSTRSTLGISLSIPLDSLFPASSSRVKVKDIEDSIRQNRLEFARLHQEVEIEIRSIVLELNRSLSSLEVLEKNVELAQKVYDLTEKEYDAGVSDLLEVQEAYDELQAAQLEVLTESYNYNVSLLNLEYALNTTLDLSEDENRNNL